MTFKSIAVWPETVGGKPFRVGNAIDKNESEDTHETYEAAEAVCVLLSRDGFGGQGKVFPLLTRVEAIEETA